MFSRLSPVLKLMIVTGVILVPTVVPHAVQDLADLKTIIDSTAATIDAAPKNSSWGFFSPASPSGTLGTADLVANISSTILRAKYLLDVDKTAWTTPDNTTTPDNAAEPNHPENSLQAPPPSNVSLDSPYVDYITSIPTLSSALIDLGRAWHKEWNSPVAEAIGALQQTITQFSSSMLEGDFLNSQSILRTIRASSSLESAQVAWSRPLNLPGAAKSNEKRLVEEAKRPELGEGQFYTHRELWGRLNKAAARGIRNEESSSKSTKPFEASIAGVKSSDRRTKAIARRFVG